MTIRCEIVSQDRMVFEGDVDIVVLPGSDGEMGILPHHAPLLTTLKYGIIKVRQKTRNRFLPLPVVWLKFNPILLPFWPMPLKTLKRLMLLAPKPPANALRKLSAKSA
jgi:hypothetical protein